MAYTLEALAADCRSALQSDTSRAGRERVTEHLRQALTDPDFVTANFGPDRTSEREILYQDPDLDFCICAHVYADAKGGKPHDHGPTWAIYGQVEGETEMTDWEITTPPSGDQPGLVKQVRSYRMRPGDAHLYEVGDVHAPQRFGPTRLLRIEGCNTDHIQRTPLQAAS